MGVRSRWILAAAVMAAVPLLGAGSAERAVAAPAGHAITWLAAGDSYASGQGLERTTKPCADGTGQNGLSTTWAVASARVLRADGTDLAQNSPDLVACTGAISADLLADNSAKLGNKHHAQWTPKMGRFNLVTFSFGGDDIGFASIMEHCESTGCPSNADVRTRIAALAKTGVDVKGVQTQPYRTFLEDVANKVVTPGGNIVVMGYPELVEAVDDWSPGRTTCAGMSAGEDQRLRGWAGDLNATIGYAVSQVNALPAAQRNGVHLTFADIVSGQTADGIAANDASLFEPSSGNRHELCSQGGSIWLNGFIKRDYTRSFHPNQAGESAMGNLGAEVISHLTWPWSPTPPPPPQTSVPVQVCPTTYGGGGQATPQPASIAARTSLAGLPPMTAYTDGDGISEVVAPSGWSCTAFIGADATTSVTVWPPGTPTPSQHAEATDGIEAFVYPGANIGGQYDLTCALFPGATAQIGQAQGPCPAPVPSAESDSTLKSDVVAFDDPPGTNGSWDNSSGSYSANGVIVYDYGGLVANTTSEEAGCLLPASEKSICTASLDDFITHYAHPVTGATNPAPPPTQPTTGSTGTTGSSGNTGSTGASGNS